MFGYLLSWSLAVRNVCHILGTSQAYYFWGHTIDLSNTLRDSQRSAIFFTIFGKINPWNGNTAYQ